VPASPAFQDNWQVLGWEEGQLVAGPVSAQDSTTARQGQTSLPGVVLEPSIQVFERSRPTRRSL
jgi:hypothetical protein